VSQLFFRLLASFGQAEANVPETAGVSTLVLRNFERFDVFDLLFREFFPENFLSNCRIQVENENPVD
jgi:hypothetical protein